MELIHPSSARKYISRPDSTPFWLMRHAVHREPGGEIQMHGCELPILILENHYSICNSNFYSMLPHLCVRAAGLCMERAVGASMKMRKSLRIFSPNEPMCSMLKRRLPSANFLGLPNKIQTQCTRLGLSADNRKFESAINNK